MSLVVERLTKTFPTRGEPLTVLRDINLTLGPGESLAITGPSGSGKSTLLHLLGALDRPTGGTVRFDGSDPFALDDVGLARFRNRRIGFVFQDHHLLPQCNVLENVLIPALVADPAPEAVEQWARTLLERVGMSARMTHRPAELSGGERQRVAVARALVLKPSLLLADEPTGNLDRSTARIVGELLLDMHRSERTMLIVVTHSAEMAGLFPRQMEMNEGTLKPVSP